MSIQKWRHPAVALVAAVYMSLFFISPAPAAMIGSFYSSETPFDDVRGRELSKIQKTLETEIVKEKLKAYGLEAKDVHDRLQLMTDDQVHMMAQASDRVLEGGNGGLGVVITVLVIILLVIVILKLMNKSIIIK